MKPLLVKLFLTVTPLFSIAEPADTTINGVFVSFHYTPSIFPGPWIAAPINASGETIADTESERSRSIMMTSMSKYPASVLQNNLRAVYYLRSMQFFGVGYGGTNSADALYLTNDGISKGYTDKYLEQSFHHELSSILYRNYPQFLDTVAWKKANIPDFDYNDPEAGVGAIRNNESSQALDTALCAKGFITQYACSGIENDLNTLAQNLFKPDNGFWEITDKYPRIQQKIKLLIAFYNRLDPLFTEAYFRKLNP